jgi:DNA ligase-1
MTTKFKPLLAATLETEEDFAKLQYPVYCSPKLDGIRVLCHPELGPVTRSLKPIPNKYIREYLSNKAFRCLDGEIIVGDWNSPNVFNRTQSAVMTQDGCPDFTYYVFDSFALSNQCPFSVRMTDAMMQVQVAEACTNSVVRVQWLDQAFIEDRMGLDVYEQLQLEDGFEGIMVRSPKGHYKYNRSTLREQILLKVKRFRDAEAKVISWEPLMRNHNTAFVDERGYQKRSSHIENKVADTDRVGKLNVIGINGEWEGVTFDIGSGFDDATRLWMVEYFDKQVKGATLTYKYLPYGSKDAPRHPIFKGFRNAE